MLTLKAIDTVERSQQISLPPLADLLQFPFFQRCTFDDIYSKANTDLKTLLDAVPLKNNRKYVSVASWTQMILPETTSVPIGSWHFDGVTFKLKDATYRHLLVSDSLATPNFLNEELDLPQFDENSGIKEVSTFVNRNQDQIESSEMKSNRFNTFISSRHIHRPVRPKRRTIRFMIRVTETDCFEPDPLSEARVPYSRVYDDGLRDYSNIDETFFKSEESTKYKSIEKKSNKIIFNSDKNPTRKQQTGKTPDLPERLREFHQIGWADELLPEAEITDKFGTKTLVLVRNGKLTSEERNALSEFHKRVHRTVTLSERDAPQNRFTTRMAEDRFYLNSDDQSSPISGVALELSPNSFQYFKQKEYVAKPAKDNGPHYIFDDITFNNERTFN